jgi:phage terminase small subunit
LNATRAAKDAGYSEDTAYSIGHENLSKPEIRAEIDRQLRERIMSPEEALERLTQHATGAHSEYVNDDGKVDIARMVKDGKAHLIKSIKETKYGKVYEFYGAQSAIQLMGKYHDLWSDKIKIVGWQDDIVQSLKDGVVSPKDVREAFPDIAEQLLLRAGK